MTEENESVYSIMRETSDYSVRKKLLDCNIRSYESIDSLLKLLESQNTETMEHTIRMRDNAILVGSQMGMSISRLCELDLATRLHDIGKITVSEDILLKPSRLTYEEFQIIKSHSENGYKIVLASEGLENIAEAVRGHHEKWDGSGYPLSLRKNEIPEMSRIICVVDAFDAMTNDRPYHSAVEIKDALNEIVGCSGSHFDPDVVEAFVKVMEKKMHFI